MSLQSDTFLTLNFNINTTTTTDHHPSIKQSSQERYNTTDQHQRKPSCTPNISHTNQPQQPHLKPQMADQHVEHHPKTDAADDLSTMAAVGERKDSVMDSIIQDVAADSADDITTSSDDNIMTPESSEPDSSLGDSLVSSDASSEDGPTPSSGEQNQAADGSDASSSDAEDDVQQPLDTAAQKVFATYELLEQILLLIPDIVSRESMKTILLAQRVNKTFQHVIKRSVKLQQILLFKPIPLEMQHVYGRGSRNIHWNALLESPARYGSYLGGSKVTNSLKQSLRIEPEAFGSSVTHFHRPLIRSERGHRQAKGEPVTESWKRMLICRNPCVFRSLEVHPWCACGQTIRKLRARSDCTMGSLWQRALQWREVAM